jgi:ketosteroid isomerase-like protein
VFAVGQPFRRLCRLFSYFLDTSLATPRRGSVGDWPPANFKFSLDFEGQFELGCSEPVIIARTAFFVFLAAGLSLAADARDEVSNAEKAVAAARSSNDAIALDRLTADDFIWVRPDGGATGKKELLEDLRASRLTKFDFDGEQRIRIFGETAVVTGARVLHDRAGDRRVMVTNVWVKKEGRWQRVASQTAKFPEPGKK